MHASKMERSAFAAPIIPSRRLFSVLPKFRLQFRVATLRAKNRILQADPTEGTPTTVLKIEPRKWTVLRQGRITPETIRAYLPKDAELCL